MWWIFIQHFQSFYTLSTAQYKLFFPNYSRGSGGHPEVHKVLRAPLLWQKCHTTAASESEAASPGPKAGAAVGLRSFSQVLFLHPLQTMKCVHKIKLLLMNVNVQMYKSKVLLYHRAFHLLLKQDFGGFTDDFKVHSGNESWTGDVSHIYSGVLEGNDKIPTLFTMNDNF